MTASDGSGRLDAAILNHARSPQKAAAQRRVSEGGEFSDRDDHLRCHGVVLRAVSGYAFAHGGSDGAGGAVGSAEHRGRQPGGGDLVADRTTPGERGPGSLEELLLDYEDYLRHRRLPQWDPDSPEARAVREVPRAWKQDPADRSELTDLSDQERYALYNRWLEHDDPAVRANAVICLIHQANFLLDRQIAALEAAFVEEGGYSEQLATERLRRRNTNQADGPAPPACPDCGGLMTLRTAKTGKNAGSQFWGCADYPACRGTAPV